MLSGKEKAQILLSQVGKNATKVLEALSKESASLLTASIDDAPNPDQQEMVLLSKEIIQKIQPDSDSSLITDASNLEEASFDTIDLDDTKDNISQTDVLNETPKESIAETVENNDEPANSDEDETLTQEHENTDHSSGTNPQKLAYVLSKQKPQIIAYFLSKYDENLRGSTLAYLPEDIKTTVESLQVTQIPLSDSVFERLNASILKEIDLVEDHEIATIKKEDVAEREENTSDGLFNAEASFDGVISFE